MRVVVLQPGYLPWLGFFDQLFRADVFVLYDDVQYDKHGWRNRNRIKTPAGPQWLTVPVLTAGRGPQRINQVRIRPDRKWARKHLTAIEQNYARAPFLHLYLEQLGNLLQYPWERLVDLTLAGIQLLTRWLAIDTMILCSSQMGIASDDRNDRLLRICQHLRATEYLSGQKAVEYLDVARFRRAGITVRFQDYAHPVYRQQHGPFVSHLSVLDLLLNHGPDSLAILTGGASLAPNRQHEGRKGKRTA